jgi:glycerophosphoryl diester phosphodiesterase
MIKLALRTVAATLFLTFGVTMAAFGASPEILVAHRGFGGDAQVKYRVAEHSLAAYDLAIQKADANIYVDLDAQWAKNSEDMMDMHDRSISRTTNGSGNVDQLTMSYMQGRSMEVVGIDDNNNGDPDNLPYGPPSIKQSLDFLKTKTINGEPVKIDIELKGDLWTKTNVSRLKTVLVNRGLFSDRVMVHSFSLTPLRYAKELGFTNIGYVAPSDGPVPSVDTVKAVGNNVLIKHTLMTQAVADQFNNAGVKIWLWTADEPSEYDKAIDYQVYALITDDLVEAQDYLAQEGVL